MGSEGLTPVYLHFKLTTFLLLLLYQYLNLATVTHFYKLRLTHNHCEVVSPGQEHNPSVVLLPVCQIEVEEYVPYQKQETKGAHFIPER